MISENRMRASDLGVVDVLEPTIAPPMTKVFQQLVDRAPALAFQAQAQQNHFADEERREVECNPGNGWLSMKFMQPRGAAKFQPRFIGPFKVFSNVRTVAYCSDLPL